MKLPLHIDWSPDGNIVWGINDANDNRVIGTDAGYYELKLEDAKEIVTACNNAMTEARAREILGSRLTADGSFRDWPFYHGDTLALDGNFNADELEAIAWWMRNKGTR